MTIFQKIKRKITRKITNTQTEKEYRIASGLKVGNNTNVYSWATIDGNWPWLISIGDNVTISSDVTILAHDASPCKVGCHTKLGRVIIGNNVFIGAKATILCNVKIGDNVIVGAGSVVSRDLESGAVYAGNPARRICSFEEYRIKHTRLNKERPDLSTIRKWNDWENASQEEKEKMLELLSDGCGYI